MVKEAVEEAKKEAEASKDEAEEAKTEEVSEEQEAGTEDQTEEKASKKFFGKKDKKDKKDEKIEELVENATYGGELRIYFNAMFDRLISKDPENDFKSIRFHGNVMVAIAFPWKRMLLKSFSAGHHLPFPKGESVCRFTGTLFLCQ